MIKETIRLQKYMANLGIDSRRNCEKHIANGLVKVNGKIVTEMGVTIDPLKDKVIFDSRKITYHKNQSITIILHKPRGYVCTTSKNEGRNIFELLGGINTKLSTIGRLDKNSEGLLLLSNDGELVYRLTHPSFEQEKIYQVMVSGNMSKDILKKLNERMLIDGYMIKAAKVRLLRPGEKENRFLLQFVLKEGRNKQIRNMCELNGLTVHRLTRVQVKKLTLKGVRPGKWRYLTTKEIQNLKK